jgi:hypothetical protein
VVAREAVSLARGYYALAGLVALLVAGYELVSKFGTDCAIVLSRDELGQGLPGVLPYCQQYLDLLLLTISILVGTVLTATALRLGHRDAVSRVLVPVGALVGVAAAYVPAAVAWWMMMDHREDPVGPLEILIAAIPFVVAVAAASVVWRVHRGGQGAVADPSIRA